MAKFSFYFILVFVINGVYPQLVLSSSVKPTGNYEEEDLKEPLVSRIIGTWSIYNPTSQSDSINFPNQQQEITRDKEFSAQSSSAHIRGITSSVNVFPKSTQHDTVGDHCKLKNGTDGKCLLITECPSALQGIKRHITPVRCGFKGFHEIVCCPDFMEKKPRPNVSPGRGSTKPNVISTTTSKPKPPIKSAVGARAAAACREYQKEAPQRVGLYIQGGIEAELAEFPHMVLLGYPEVNEYRYAKLLNGSEVHWRCGGTLIARQFVLTAAHCVDGSEEPFVARVGELDYSTDADDADPVDVGIEDILFYPDYKLLERYHDIALVKLARPVRFTNYVQPACLPDPLPKQQTTRKETYLANRKLTVAGWGDLAFAMEQASPKLMKAEMIVVSTDECRKEYNGTYSKLPHGVSSFGQLCAQDRIGSADACTGDSGGPLQEPLPNPSPLHRVIGITSFGEGCTGHKPSIFTRVAAYVDWIEDKVWPNK